MKIRRLTLLGTVLVLCFLLLTVQSRGWGVDPADLIALVTTPVHQGLATVQRAAAGLWATYQDWKSVRAENRRLRADIERLRVEALGVAETTAENVRLRRLLDMKSRLPLDTVASEVIAREWGGWVRSLTVDRGRGDDVRRLTPVISPEGLVGRVVDVRPRSAVVQVLSDPASVVGAHVLGSRTPGLVEGDARGTLRFKYMARDGAGLRPGDLVVTSGQGRLFPRGIPIGRVRVIDGRGSALFHYATLDPAVDFARLGEVLLVTGERAADLTAFFPAGG